ncbi:MAG: AtpZ/AtpI family protein [Blautia sp.]|nr:AtpZ/AtpI family protein [Blautia sp.]
MKKWANVFKNISLLTQLGLSLAAPLLMCLGLCWWLTTSKGVGGWVFIPGLILGLGSSAMVGYKFYVAEMKRTEKEIKEKKEKISFNQHG